MLPGISPSPLPLTETTTPMVSRENEKLKRRRVGQTALSKAKVLWHPLFCIAQHTGRCYQIQTSGRLDRLPAENMNQRCVRAATRMRCGIAQSP